MNTTKNFRFTREQLPLALGWLGEPGRAAGLGHAELDQVAAEAGLELVPVSGRACELLSMIRRSAPAIAQLGRSNEHVVLLSRGRRHVQLLTVDLQKVQVSVDDLFELLCANPRCEALVQRLPARARARSRRVLMERLARPEELGAWWLVRVPPEAGLGRLLHEQGVWASVAGWLLCHLLAFGCWVGSFLLIGRGALAGELQLGWLLGWVLLLVTVAPLRAATLWLQGQIALRAGVVLKQRLLVGALKLPPDEVRQQGVGALLARVQDADVLERFALDGALGAVLAVLELAVAGVLLGLAGHWLLASAMAAMALGVPLLALAWRERRLSWTLDRVSLTHDLVEGLLGQATRATQAHPDRWHEEEDAALERYVRSSRRADEVALAVSALPLLWMAGSVLLLGTSFIAGTATAGHLAVGLGGILLVGRSIEGLSRGLQDLVGASIAWGQIERIYRASVTPPSRPAPEVASLPEPHPEDPVIELQSVSFRYSDGKRPTLSEVSASVHRRDRVLVQGPSGGGKSTLAALMLGLREPQTGSVSLLGLDRPVWGQEGWRVRVTGAPQFHQNHILAGTLAFNLLLGRRWPPTPTDLEQARGVCLQLGLGPLLERMPAGLQQLVGETGWQLSHGERSRVFLARALLQPAHVLILDESTAALDAQSTEWCLYRIHAQPAAILVVAHP
jgi:ATP-binding cassette subfamily B protein